MAGLVSVLSLHSERRGKDVMVMYFWNFLLKIRKCRVVIWCQIYWLQLFLEKKSQVVSLSVLRQHRISLSVLVLIQNKLPL